MGSLIEIHRPAPPLTGQTREQRLISSADTLRERGLLLDADYHRTIARIRGIVSAQKATVHAGMPDRKEPRSPSIPAPNRDSAEIGRAEGRVGKPSTTEDFEVCPRCDGRTIYIGTDVKTGAEWEVSCLHCDETGKVRKVHIDAALPE